MTNTEPEGWEITMKSDKEISHIFQVYPTTIRTLGIGLASAWARVGAMLTPFVAQVSCPSIKIRHIYVPVHVKNLYDTSIMYICTMYIQI